MKSNFLALKKKEKLDILVCVAKRELNGLYLIVLGMKNVK